MKKIIALIVLLSLVGCSLVGCSTVKDEVASETSTQERSEEPAAESFPMVIEGFRKNINYRYDEYRLSDGYIYWRSTPVDSIHTFRIDITGKTIFRDNDLEILYNQDQHKLYICRKGEVKSAMLPDNNFCGFHPTLGVLFRVSGELYQLDATTFESNLIVSNVAHVVATSYPYRSEVDNGHTVYRPLLLMENGNLKVLLNDGELTDPIYEGGYVEVRPLY